VADVVRTSALCDRLSGRGVGLAEEVAQRRDEVVVVGEALVLGDGDLDQDAGAAHARDHQRGLDHLDADVDLGPLDDLVDGLVDDVGHLTRHDLLGRRGLFCAVLHAASSRIMSTKSSTLATRCSATWLLLWTWSRR
jgi:hypothetical protein